MSTSVIDYIFRELAVSYLGREDLAHVPVDEIHIRQLKPTEESQAEAAAPAPVEAKAPVAPKVEVTETAEAAAPKSAKAESSSYETDYDKAKQLGYSGDSCPECGSMTMVRNGTCLKCITCGSTTGCS